MAAFRRAGNPFLRAVLLLGLVAAVGSALWVNHASYVSRFNAQGRLEDKLNAFTPEQRGEIIKVISRFQRDYKLKLHVRARPDLFTSGDAVEGEILLGLCPPQRQMVLFLPGIWRVGIGEGALRQFKENIMEPAFDSGEWPEATLKILLQLERQVYALSR
jgi:hypothetical protein